MLENPNTTPEDARHVLWHFGDRVNGWQPGSFTETLLSAAGKADATNLSRLGTGFPGLVGAVRLAQYSPDGMDRLVEIAEGKR